MKIYEHLQCYFAEFCLEWEIFQIKLANKNQNTFYVQYHVEKYGTARQATDDNIIRHMRFACWVTKATDTRSKRIMLIAFPRRQ